MDSGIRTNCGVRCFYGYTTANIKLRENAWLLLTMASLLDRYDLVSRLFFVFQSIGSIFVRIPVFTTAIKRFVLAKSNSTASDLQLLPNESFVAECEGLAYLKGSVVSEKILFQELHDISLELGQPLATVLVSSQETCRICGKTLVVESKVHPVVIYSLHRGTYLGSCVTKVCRRCKAYEHYGYWTHGRKKQFTKESLELDFLLSTEDTAFEFALLRQYAQLLILGALPFSTFAASYNRRFNYHNVDPEVCENDHPKVKRLKK